MDTIRPCDRPGCGEPASASLSYDYAQRIAWIDELTPEPEPPAYDLCAAHAARLRVPRGWTRDDRRVALRPVFHRALAV